MKTPSHETLQFEKLVNPVAFLREALAATTVAKLEAVLKKLPIVPETDFYYDVENPATGWKEGKLHWVPIGREHGNAGRIRLAARPENPLAERGINAMEALIELARLRELKTKPSAPPPRSPREAVQRYFGLPALPELTKASNKALWDKARELADQIQLTVEFDKPAKEFAVQLRDFGTGQTPARMHRTLLSLGTSDKGDKPYLIGVFGQGGSSTYMASLYSWCVSRRDPIASDGNDGRIGWTAVKHIYPGGRRDDYFAYLACSPEGQVPALPAAAADAVGFKPGTLFSHLRYDFSGTGGSAISRTLFPALNHVLYNPVLPLQTTIGGTEATLWGNSYRLADATARQKTDKDKLLPVATV